MQRGKIVTTIPAPDLQIAHLQLRDLGDTRPGVVEKEQKCVFAAPRLVLRSGTASMASMSALVSHPIGGDTDFFDAMARIWPHHST